MTLSKLEESAPDFLLKTANLLPKNPTEEDVREVIAKFCEFFAKKVPHWLAKIGHHSSSAKTKGMALNILDVRAELGMDELLQKFYSERTPVDCDKTAELARHVQNISDRMSCATYGLAFLFHTNSKSHTLASWVKANLQSAPAENLKYLDLHLECRNDFSDALNKTFCAEAATIPPHQQANIIRIATEDAALLVRLIFQK